MVVELGARSRHGVAGEMQILASLDDFGPQLNLRFTPVAGINGKGAGPADRLTSDGHFPREQEMNRDLSEREP